MMDRLNKPAHTALCRLRAINKGDRQMEHFCIEKKTAKYHVKYYHCHEDDIDKQKACKFYCPHSSSANQWCKFNYDNQGISDLCHNHEAQMEAQKEAQP